MLLKKIIITFCCCIFSLISVAKNPVKVIFETDMGNDIDDALALDMLYKYQDIRLVGILLISSNKANEYTIPFLDIMNNFYGYPDIPLATVKKDAVKEGKNISYVEVVSTFDKKSDSFRQTLKATDSVTEAVQKYREILSKEEDNSIVIISVGFLTNLKQLLCSPPDKYSNLNGKDLVSKKVKLLSIMGGDFRQGMPKGEFNIRFDIPAAQYVFKNWPTEMIVSTWEVGAGIIFPGGDIIGKINYKTPHPLVIAYENYLPMPYNRETWDLTSVLIGVEPVLEYFDLSQSGNISVDNKGVTSFSSSKKGNCKYLIVNEDKKEKVLKRFIQLITQKPKIY